MAVQLQWPVVVTAIRDLASQLIIDNQQVLKSPAHRGEPVLKVGVVRISNGFRRATPPTLPKRFEAYSNQRLDPNQKD